MDELVDPAVTCFLASQGDVSLKPLLQKYSRPLFKCQMRLSRKPEVELAHT